MWKILIYAPNRRIVCTALPIYAADCLLLRPGFIGRGHTAGVEGFDCGRHRSAHFGAKAARPERKPAVLRQLSGPFAAAGTRRHHPQHLPSHCQKLCASHRLPVCCQKLFKRLPPDCTELPANRKAGSLCPPFFLQAFSPQIPTRQRRGAFSDLYQSPALPLPPADFAQMSTSSATGRVRLPPCF